MAEPTRIYLASSWRNPWYPVALAKLREAGFEVYDFRDDAAFQWSDIKYTWLMWTPEEAREAMSDPRVRRAFNADKAAIDACDVLILLLPCGASAHTEFGYAAGQGKRTLIVLPVNDYESTKGIDPRGLTYLMDNRNPGAETMYLFADHLCLNIEEAVQMLTGEGGHDG
ncbi:hypothetical protein LCGC14_1296760 [marine sediment metagenome]|uniref:Nucleoside 2-deoxyribosyltransferase n=1 Tax=marine sediment metagenome TaxID=412755 RepID=A0A0F9KSJ4_9ZZZZ